MSRRPPELSLAARRALADELWRDLIYKVLADVQQKEAERAAREREDAPASRVSEDRATTEAADAATRDA